MNEHFRNDPAGAFYALQLPEFGCTWAGASPSGQGFCLGSETGNIVHVDVAMQRRGDLHLASPSGEAINGIAFSRNWLAVTTRKDVSLIGPFMTDSSHMERVTFAGGGRDVTVAPTSGHFLVPLGPDGIMFLRPGTGENDPVLISRPEKSDLNFCRAIVLPREQAIDLVVCAGRRGGLGYAEYGEGTRGHTLHTVAFSDLDFVDICSIATHEKPLAVVAGARDGSLVFFEDILTDKAPKTIKFKGVKGTVYRVLSCNGNIFILTSKGLFGLIRLAATIAQGENPFRVTTDILALPVEASDANIVSNKWLLAVGADEVYRFDTEKIPIAPGDNGIIANNGSAGEQPEVGTSQPRWEDSCFQEELEYKASAV